MPGSGGSEAPGACSCAAEKVSNLQDTLPNHLVYPRLSRPQSESGLPAIHVKRKWGHSLFCLKAASWCGLIGSSDSSEAIVFSFLKLFSNLSLKEQRVRGAHQVGQPVVMAGQTTVV